jgi:hypothetical protein
MWWTIPGNSGESWYRGDEIHRMPRLLSLQHTPDPETRGLQVVDAAEGAYLLPYLDFESMGVQDHLFRPFGDGDGWIWIADIPLLVGQEGSPKEQAAKAGPDRQRFPVFPDVFLHSHPRLLVTPIIECPPAG